jgi:ribosome-associated protein
VADYFVICSGNSNTQVSSIAGNVEKKVRNELQDRPWHVEGSENAMWVLVDYISVVVHVFQKHIREYYDIEELWGDAKVITVEN